MKRAGICFRMMIKRMGKHPAYWILLLLFPAAIFAVPKLNRAAEEERILVGYVVEMCSLPMDFESGDLFEYIKYTDVQEMKEDIATGKLSCGVFFDAEFANKLKEQDYRHCITLYLPEGMNVGGMVQEDIFSRVYQAYSAVWYAELLGDQGCQMKPEEVLRKFSEYQKEGKVFAVDYEVYEKSGKKSFSKAGDIKSASVLSLRSVLAFLTLLSASLGALDAGRDRKRKLGQGIVYRGIKYPGIRSSGILRRNILTITAAGAPILPATLFLAGGMIFHTASMIPEIISALLYGLVLWLLAVIVSKLVPVKLLEGFMPCFLLLVLLCCPVFFDLGGNIPLIGHLSKIFPITWYLRFWG